jgi:glyoxylase-like metal-dependent hydrolase (beta-lactamase superfamily II)
MADHALTAALHRVGAQLIVRGWLSSNSIVFTDTQRGWTAVVDTGYFRHAKQTVQLVETALAGNGIDHIVNTHLHSDHCGGNHALQERFPGATTSVPIGFQAAVEPWDDERLSFRDTGQHCPPFRVHRFIAPGERLRLGAREWEVHAAPGHDADAVMFFEPRERLLISGDALWERRLAIIFPELAGAEGFETTHRTLDMIEQLAPRWVLPGHGQAFADVSAAVRRSRERLELFAAQPDRHREHAARALAMFRMLEVQSTSRQALEAWMVGTPIFVRALGKNLEDGVAGAKGLHVINGGARLTALRHAARQVVDSLLQDQVLRVCGGDLTVDPD